MLKNLSLFFSSMIEVFRDRIFIFLTLANLILIGLIWFFWLTRISPSGYQIYTQFYISNSREITAISPPLLASIILFVNFVLALFSRKREALASYLAIGSSLFILALVLVLVRYYLSLI